MNPERTYVSNYGDKKSSRLVVNTIAVISDSMVNPFQVNDDLLNVATSELASNAVTHDITHILIWMQALFVDILASTPYHQLSTLGTRSDRQWVAKWHEGCYMHT